MFSKQCFEIFEKSIADYHINDLVDQTMLNPFDYMELKKQYLVGLIL